MSKKLPEPADELRANCHELCQDVIDHLKLLRDYATTPGNTWLAQGELSRVGATISQIDSVLEQIKLAETDSATSR